jgi:RNA-binding protein
MTDPETRRRLRSEGQRLRPAVEVGRRGLEASVIDELRDQLKRSELVKVRIQRSASAEGREGEEWLAESLATAVGAELIERRGHTVLLYRPRRGGA